jgi:G:T-mismatch repair DNA endonuclease (very short patch repair protein)
MSLAGKGKPKSLRMREKLSATTKGRPKPWVTGEHNGNFRGAAFTPEICERIRQSRKKTGQGWTPAHCEAHRQKMLGSSNVMRGTHHTPDTLAKISEIKKRQYREGRVNVRKYKISGPEKAIAEWLHTQGIGFKTQYHIQGIPFWYDFYLPDRNLLIEFQGDYWHANPRKYPSGTLMKFWHQKPRLVEEIWRLDAEKQRAADGAGFKISHIWEMDFKRKGLEVVMAEALV